MLEKILHRQVGTGAWHVPLWTVMAAGFGIAWLIYKRGKDSNLKQSIQSQPLEEKATGDKKSKRKVKILYGSQTGKAKKFAEVLQSKVEELGHSADVIELSANYDHETLLPLEAEEGNIVIVVVSTYTEGQPPEDAKYFYMWLEDAAEDFRVTKSTLSGMHYAVVGLGNSLYSEHFNTVAKNVDSWFKTLSANRILPLCLADENVSSSKNKGLEEDFKAWLESSVKNLRRAIDGRKVTAKNCEDTCTKQCSCKTKKEGEGQGEAGGCSSDEEEDHVDDSDDEDPTPPKPAIIDLEDLGNIMKLSKESRLAGGDPGADGPREMITPLLRESLEKQGYKLIGSHSGVKLCRWTKSMLRGRGGCYKHTFYGIESHRCMETTPSLACANKCVFCWRHHTNPVGTEWKWKMDDAQTVFDGAINNHIKLIKQFKGVPGVKPDRFEEAMNVQHCALSLVGEPIMYPEINKFVELLHSKQISSFLVTNAQFPQELRELLPVTQLYVSVDAGTKESLKKIDRPLFKDFWERYIDSLTALRDKGQRTVYRLTLVKAWNTEELENYAKLVSLGNPDFIEVKGVTYCGESKASTLTMENVPWHEEVVKFVSELADRLPEYEIASEHEHSNCLLIAHKKFKKNGDWWTWIDYQQFHKLWRRYQDSNGKETFSSLDYMAPTPGWAVYGSTEKGFDPDETRFFRKKKSQGQE
ncbi:S-adenosyl-L-methionine-dependent tRNA 4-demethylwyosine synthase TYW1-like [Physella acuta]|uniref:S-adenosyl-L-methionine-dependent tRNA 4-demethylwyosine synthase TYW1-like n=1 Tax=Physella acuta TaxID=109671 RepID=UPI0027DB943E|nr:S-adenosyl-L-methionine-dependent tRNA 4-demethylwyosine synthase TYW1-like [Physella acuta]XP_059163198.1 S-adenosyl-L-methionine-dependent tRNA 4-demethylwyosine synthase TYW1-like [Physella acuta]XP_059163199.1 S-adenosyl-L-methionine-dependent tRNA 4-demethylwyosine synthase TYW1-like [Physella acuta]